MWLLFEGEGPLQRGPSAIRLPDGAFVIGRGPDCHLVVAGSKVSRLHVTLTRHGDSVTFLDGGSMCGTLINGARQDSGDLVPGDLLTIDRVSLRLAKDLPRPSAVPRKGEPQPPAPRSQPPSVDWRPFRTFFEELRCTSDPRAIVERLLGGLVSLFGAERGFVLLRGETGGDLVPVASHCVEDVASFAAVSSTVSKRAFEGKAVVYISDSTTDDICRDAPSLIEDGQSRVIVCGPLIATGDTYGVIYVDALRGTKRLTPEHLPLFETVTGLASDLLRAVETRRNLLSARRKLELLRRLTAEEHTLVLGTGNEARELRGLIAAAASQDVTVLITGETGTGKEMVARELHSQSARREGPFVPVNCSALPHDIIEAELFGAEKGAFTGATERRLGRFELASRGTLFLDEIGELPLDVQVKLLRVLQEHAVERIGGGDAVPLDFRLVCATNADLEALVRDGRFRQDFYYRVNVFRVPLKPLRQRPGDIMPLARHFLALFAKRFGKSVTDFTPEAEEVITSFSWPGNIRELKNAVERAMVIETTSLVRLSSLPIAACHRAAGAGLGATSFLEELPHQYDQARERFEALFLKRSYDEHQGNVAAMARETGLARKTIYKRLKALGIATD